MPAVPSQLTSLDFFEIKESIKSYLRTRSEFTDYDFEGSSAAYLIDVLAEIFLMEEEPTVEQLKEAIQRSVVSNQFSPVFMGSAYKNRGVHPTNIKKLLSINNKSKWPCIDDYLPLPFGSCL